MMSLHDAKAFYADMRAGLLGPTLSMSEVDGCTALLGAMGGADWCIGWTAYGLATAYHETAHTMQPIEEFGGLSYFKRMYDVTGRRPKLAAANGNIHPGDGARFFGRGYVQLTWRNNYKRAGERLGVDLLENPEYALQPDLAARIMVEGMAAGWFTGRSLKTYLPNEAGTGPEFTKARAIINGADKAALISGYAVQFQKALANGAWLPDA
jgi:putative chitinase